MAKLESCPAVWVVFFLKEPLPLPGFRVDGIRSVMHDSLDRRLIRYKINPHNGLRAEQIRSYIRDDFKEIDFGNIIEIDIDICVVESPLFDNDSAEEQDALASIRTGSIRHDGWRYGSHGRIRASWYTLAPYQSSEPEFEKLRRMLEIVCRELGRRIRLSTSVAFDFTPHAADDARELLGCLSHCGAVRQMSIRSSSLWLKSGERYAVQKYCEQRVDVQLSVKKHAAFQFQDLPTELQLMIMAYVVKDPGTIVLHYPTERTGKLKRTRRRVCCKSCRAFDIDRFEGKDNCRCRFHAGNLSSTCECVTLSSPVFVASKHVRELALQAYWSVNAFTVHGTMSMHPEHRNVSQVLYQVKEIPLEYLKVIRHLIVSPESFHSLIEARCHEQSHCWIALLDLLRDHTGRNFLLQICLAEKWQSWDQVGNCEMSLEGIERDPLIREVAMRELDFVLTREKDGNWELIFDSKDRQAVDDCAALVEAEISSDSDDSGMSDES